jgi:ABC-type dipeptide/oligopeptide/nickel transport system ATPase component
MVRAQLLLLAWLVIAGGIATALIALLRFFVPVYLRLSDSRHEKWMKTADLQLRSDMLALAERPGYSSKFEANGTITIIPAPHVSHQPALPPALPQEDSPQEEEPVTQPSMDELYQMVPYNGLQVAFGRALDTKQIVTVKIPESVHFKLVGGSGFGKSCLAAALLDIATKRNDPDHLRIALLDLEHKTSRLFEELPHVFEMGRRRLVARDADEVARALGWLKKELDRRAAGQLSAPLLLIYVEEMLSLQYEVDEKLKAQMLADLAILALRGRKYGMFLMACTQTDYSTKELKEAQKQFRTRSGFAIDPSAARAAGFVNTELINQNYRFAKPGQFLLERPAFSSLVLAPRYDVEQKLLEIDNPGRRYTPTSLSTSQPVIESFGEVDYEAEKSLSEVAGDFPLPQAPQAALNAQEWRIIQKWRKGDSISQIIQDEFGVKGGAAFTNHARDIQALISRFLPVQAEVSHELR